MLEVELLQRENGFGWRSHTCSVTVTVTPELRRWSTVRVKCHRSQKEEDDADHHDDTFAHPASKNRGFLLFLILI